MLPLPDEIMLQNQMLALTLIVFLVYQERVPSIAANKQE